jgi:hypothetical protein
VINDLTHELLMFLVTPTYNIYMASVSLDFMCFPINHLPSKVNLYQLQTPRKQKFKLLPQGIAINNNKTKVVLFDSRGLLFVNLPTQYSKEYMISNDMARLD